jgi:hypothetical protein
MVLLAAAALLIVSAAWAQSDFYVVAGGGPPMGTKITSVPYTINNPGFYFLGGNLNYSSQAGNAITVNADNVTLDLMGFSLTGGWGNGIYMSGRTNVEVRNGSIEVFNCCVYEDNANGQQHRIVNIRIRSAYNGIWLSGTNHLIKNCSVMSITNAGLGLNSGLITDCLAAGNAVFGIWNNGPGSVLRSTACNNGTVNFSFGAGGATATRILVDGNSAYGGGTRYRINAPSGSVLITGNNAGYP